MDEILSMRQWGWLNALSPLEGWGSVKATPEGTSMCGWWAEAISLAHASLSHEPTLMRITLTSPSFLILACYLFTFHLITIPSSCNKLDKTQDLNDLNMSRKQKKQLYLIWQPHLNKGLENFWRRGEKDKSKVQN